MRALYICLFLYIASAAYGQEHPKPKAEGKENKAAPTQVQRGTEDAPFVIKIVPPSAAPETETEAREGEQKDWDWGNLSERWTAAFTGLLVLVTGALAFYTALLFGATRNLVEETSDVEAPYLIPELLGIGHSPEEPIRPMVTYTMRNHGRTPAVIRRFQDRLRLLQQLPEVEQDVYGNEQLSQRPEQYIPIGPAHIPITQGQTGTHFYCRLFPDDLQNLQANFRFYLLGRVEYQDLSGRTFTQGFCYQILNVPSLPASGETPQVKIAELHHLRTGADVYNYRREGHRQRGLWSRLKKAVTG